MNLADFDQEDFDSRETIPRRYTQCFDRMCGASDCPNCHPENFRGGVWVEDRDYDEE